MKRKIYAYVITTDNGLAPCVENGKLSLAICKPVMRRSIGNLLTTGTLDEIIVIGICGKSCAGANSNQRNKLIYAAKLSKKDIWETEAYHTTHVARADNLYHLVGGNLERNDKGGDVHRYDKATINKDLNHKYVFLTADFVYYGHSCEILSPKLPGFEKEAASLARAHRCNFSSDTVNEVFDWYNFQDSKQKGKQGNPITTRANDCKCTKISAKKKPVC